MYGTERRWSNFKFLLVQIDIVLIKKLEDYRDDDVYLERKNEYQPQWAMTDIGSSQYTLMFKCHSRRVMVKSWAISVTTMCMLSDRG